jgi:hypothetical protein
MNRKLVMTDGNSPWKMADLSGKIGMRVCQKVSPPTVFTVKTTVFAIKTTVFTVKTTVFAEKTTVFT